MARIMIIEEKPDACYFMCLVLKTNGHSVEPHVSPVQALSALANGRFDAVILDMDSATYDAIEVFQRIHEVDKAIRPLLIAENSSRHLEAIRGAGFISEDALVERPVTPSELAALAQSVAASAGQ